MSLLGVCRESEVHTFHQESSARVGNVLESICSDSLVADVV